MPPQEQGLPGNGANPEAESGDGVKAIPSPDDIITLFGSNTCSTDWLLFI